MGIGDWGLGVGVWGVWGLGPSPQTPTPKTNPQKKIFKIFKN